MVYIHNCKAENKKDTEPHNPMYAQLRTNQDVGFNFAFEENTQNLPF